MHKIRYIFFKNYKVIIFWTCVVDSLHTFADEQGHSLKDWLLHVDPTILGIMYRNLDILVSITLENLQCFDIKKFSWYLLKDSNYIPTERITQNPFVDFILCLYVD